MNKTKIDWCDYTWNPVWGCLNTCSYCYARATAHRWGKSFEPHWREKNFLRPFRKKPSRIFVNSMSEVAYWEPEWWERVLRRIVAYPEHRFLFLTKHPVVYEGKPFPDNCWLGVTITHMAAMASFADSLFDTTWDDKYLLFLSIEPILEPIELYVRPDWIILGAETGNRAGRVIPPAEWIQPFLSIKTPVFMKHNLPWSGPWRKEFPE